MHRAASANAPSEVLVLSVLGSVLEDRISAAAPGRVRVAAPAVGVDRRLAARPGYPVHAIQEWGDLGEFLAVADRVETGNVVAGLEPAVLPAAFCRAMLGIRDGISYETAVRCTDKHRMKEALAAAGLPVAAHRVAHGAADVEAFAGEVGYPVVVKPRDGFGAINTHVVRSAGELAALAGSPVFGAGVGPDDLAPLLAPTGVGDGLAAHEGGFLVERYIDIAAEYHCEVLRVGGETRYAIPGRYMTPLLSEAAILGSVFLDPHEGDAARVGELSGAAATALGIDDGFAHAELLRDTAGRWWIGEVAARRGGAGLPHAIEVAYGIDTLDLDARWAAGVDPDPPVRPRPGVFGWAGVRIQRTGRIAGIATRDELMEQPDVVDAVMLVQPGRVVSPAGSGLFAAYVYYHGESDNEVLAAMRTTADRLGLRYTS